MNTAQASTGSTSATNGSYDFQMVLWPHHFPEDKVYEMNGDFELEGDERIDDAYDKIIDWYCAEENTQRGEFEVLSFLYW